MRAVEAKPRKGIKVAVVTTLALITLFGFAAYRLFSSLAPPEGVISGTITIEPSLLRQVAFGDVLFITTRREGMGPPLAVKRIPNPSFPLSYTLGPEDRMLPDVPFEGEVFVAALIKKDGVAGPPRPGDLAGVYVGNPVWIGQTHVDIVIDTVY